MLTRALYPSRFCSHFGVADRFTCASLLRELSAMPLDPSAPTAAEAEAAAAAAAQRCLQRPFLPPPPRPVHLHVGGFFSVGGVRPGLAAVLRRAAALGCTVSLDTNYDSTQQWGKVRCGQGTLAKAAQRSPRVTQLLAEQPATTVTHLATD